MVMETETGKLDVHEAGLVISRCRGGRRCDYKGKWGRGYRQVGDKEYTNRHTKSRTHLPVKQPLVMRGEQLH
jgi:hypothetical protein